VTTSIHLSDFHYFLEITNCDFAAKVEMEENGR